MNTTKILHRLKTKSLFIFILTIFPSFITAFIIFRYAERTAKASLYARLQTESQNIADDVLRWVNKRITDLRMMSDFIEPASTSWQPINEYLATMKKYYPDYERIVFVNLAGEVVADSAGEQGEYRDSIWFQKAMEKGEYISDVFWKEQKPMFIISVIKRRGNKSAGVLCGFIRLKYLGNLINDTLFGKSRKSYLVNRDGIIIACKGNEQTNPRLSSLYAEEI